MFPLLRILLFFAILLFSASCDSPSASEVVLYSSVDAGYAREISQLFEEETGIAVRLVSDTEATKSSGLLNRLIAEQKRPVADVFWSGDAMRSHVLSANGLIDAYVPSHHYEEIRAPFLTRKPDYPISSVRLRMMIIHPDAAASDRPRFVVDLSQPEFASRSCLANPLFGTSSMHAAMLFDLLGKERAEQFYNDFSKNGGTMLSSNGEVKRRVASGEFSFGLTDSDDINVAIVEGSDIEFLACGQSPDFPGVALIPSAAVLIREGPHPEEGKKLVDFLSSAKMETVMSNSYAAHFPLRTDLPGPENFDIDLQNTEILPMNLEQLAKTAEDLTKGFLLDWTAQQSLANPKPQ